MDLSEEPVSGAAQRRRQRRLRSWLRHERVTVAMPLADRRHHSSRGQTFARASVWGHELNYTATIRDPPTPQPELFSLYEEPGGARPDRLSEVRPQDRDLRRTVDQFVGAVPGFPALDVPVPQMEVPKILPEDVPMRTTVRDTQLAEQLVQVPTIVSWILLQLIMEQNVDIPVPGRGGRIAGLQGFLPRQSSTAQLASQERIS